MMNKLSKTLVATGVLLTSMSAMANDSNSDWEFALEPYLQATSIYGDASIGRANDLPVDVEFDDILETLDSGLMLHFEAFNKSTHWGIALDYAYMDLRQDASTPKNGLVNVRARQGVLEGLVFKRFEYGDHTVDYFGGIRWWDNDISAGLQVDELGASVGVEHDEDWVDAVIGARYWYSFAEDWRFHVRGDIGGFGLESDFTSSIFTGLQWQATETLDINFGYKATWVDYKSNDTASQPGYFEYDTLTKGPTIGASFKF